MSINNMETMDINLLFSIVNMKLRNDFADLDDLCLGMDLDREALQSRLKTAGFEYASHLKRFNKSSA